MEYHRSHISIDAIHGNDWMRNIIFHLVELSPKYASQIAEGAMLILESSSYYLDSLLNNITKSSNQLN